MRCSRCVVLVVGVVLAVGCVTDVGDDVGAARGAASRPGPWALPLSVRRAGEAQHVGYDPAGPWNGGAACRGGLEPGTRQIATYLMGRFSGIRSYGGYACRPNTAATSQLSVHGTGRALDLFIPLHGGSADNDRGDPVGNHLVVNAQRIGIQYIVWDRTDWAGARSGRKDGSYGGPHPHHDHLHVELTRRAARRETPFFVDRDGDGVRNTRDNCPDEPNRAQWDRDGDGVGNACDNCIDDDNGGQRDRDHDGVGDRCDNCPDDRNAMQADRDGDGRGNRCDNCPGAPNPWQRDTDGDGIGDACDPDAAADAREEGPPEGEITCVGEDTDGDGDPDACDADRDGDGVDDTVDTCPDVADPDQRDSDGDGAGDACDPDADGDDVLDDEDLCPEHHDPDQADTDADGVGDACDPAPHVTDPTAPGESEAGDDVHEPGDLAAGLSTGCSAGGRGEAAPLGLLLLLLGRVRARRRSAQ